MLTIERLQRNFSPLLEGSGLVLVEVKVAGGRGRPKFTLVLDHSERSVTIGELQRWSRRFEEELDMMADAPRSYALDVTSPGVGHPLKHEWELKKNVGRELEVELTPAEPGAKPESYKGVLSGVDEATLHFEDGRTIERERVTEAKVALPW